MVMKFDIKNPEMRTLVNALVLFTAFSAAALIEMVAHPVTGLLWRAFIAAMSALGVGLEA